MSVTAIEPPPKPTLAEATRFWLRLGFISFGGPAGQIAILHQETVERRRWISERRFLHALNYCMLLPGPEAQQLATYIGWLLHRVRGGIVAGVLFVLPSLLILVALSWAYVRFGHLTWIAGLFHGIKPAVTALVLKAAHRVASRALRNRWLWLIAAAAFVALAVFRIPCPWVILGAAAAGALGGRLSPQHFAAGSGHASQAANGAAALIDDHTPAPAHASVSAWRIARVILLGAMLFALPMLALDLCLGWQHTLTQMSWFFTKAALLTFGGAYAVLPYVNQGAVLQFHWLQPAQMIDGLALGETTPGPLIMVVAFVGFVGGWQSPEVVALMAGNGFLAGALAATLVTWFTFLPSFIFIFAGGPLVERTRHELRVTAPLTAITAAVVGVILNLALFFAWHVLWPRGLASGPTRGLDAVAALIMLAAAVALIGYRISVTRVIAASAVAGLLWSLLQTEIGP